MIFSVPLSLGYELDLWGRVRRSVESARAQEQASADDLQAVKLAIQAEVAVIFFGCAPWTPRAHCSVQIYKSSVNPLS